jgi:hypothetical protein
VNSFDRRAGRRKVWSRSMPATAIEEPVQTHRCEHRDARSPRPVSRSRWAAIGAAVAVSLGAGGIGLTHAISTNGGNVYVPVAPCRLFDTRPGTVTVGPRATPLAAGETYTQQVTGDNGQCIGIPADATGVAMNVTAVDATAAGYLTLFPADLGTAPNASNLNWVPGAPPTPNKVDVKLSPTGAIKLFNAAGTVNVLADIVGYYQDHNHDDRYPRKMQITYSLAAGAVSAPIVLPTDVPVSLTAANTFTGSRGVGFATLYSPSSGTRIVEWTGQNSPGTGTGANEAGYEFTQGTHIIFIDFAALVDIEVNDGTSIRVHNSSPGPTTGVVTLTW